MLLNRFARGVGRTAVAQSRVWMSVTTIAVAPAMQSRFFSKKVNYALDSCRHKHHLKDEKIQEYIEKELQGSQPDLEDILEGNEQWRKDVEKKIPGFFDSLGKGQNPRYLYIGCADARVDPSRMMQVQYGDLFIHRNVGNLANGSDLNFLTVLEFAVTRLQIPHIVVCGHYDCGAVRGSVQQQDHGVIENWLRNIRDVQRLHVDELEKIEDPEQRHRRLVELNVVEQCFNVLKTGCVQRLRMASHNDPSKKFATPRVHALVFDPATGRLHKLDVDWKEETKDWDKIYNLYPTEV